MMFCVDVFISSGIMLIKICFSVNCELLFIPPSHFCTIYESFTLIIFTSHLCFSILTYGFNHEVSRVSKVLFSHKESTFFARKFVTLWIYFFNHTLVILVCH